MHIAPIVLFLTQSTLGFYRKGCGEILYNRLPEKLPKKLYELGIIQVHSISELFLTKMSLERKYEYFFAVMVGMAMLVAAGTSVAAEGNTDRSISLDPLTQATGETARTIETKSGSHESVPVRFTRTAVYEKAEKKDEIIFVLLLIILHFLIVLLSIVFRY
ncbi:uncharacterized protein LOC131059701 [Cryptomeria japonica]|uniref:uncharacterized protein LOC131059701 n=1 Tax=Cryptomeria japonica TaxID=3369 RepID=UPI0025AC3F29|nr:uncharacterized protein LOC131059701 [Cryptomeria japonica]